MSKDYLKLDNGDKNLEVGINFGYVDRVAGVFDFKRSLPQNVTGYRLSLDIEHIKKEDFSLLEKFLHSENKLIDAIISLDGIISKGKAKLAAMFSFDGISYDLELIN